MSVDVGTARGYLDLDISGFLRGLRTAQEESESASKNLATKIGGNLTTAGNSLTSASKTLTKSITVPIAGAGAAAFKLSSNFESAMAQVKTIADSDKKSIGAIKDEIVDLSNEAGMAASDLAAATYQAISAGVDTASSVEFVANASKLATAGFTDTTTAVDALTTIINAYGLSAEDSTHISDILISTQNKGKTTVNELAATMGKVIPTANAMGVSLEDLGVAYSYLTAGGIATAESTTYLNGMFNELGKSGTNVSDALKERTGKSFNELMKDGTSLREVLEVLEAEAQETGIGFNDLWGSQEAGKAALALLNTSTEEYNETLKDFQTTIGDTETAYGIMAETTESKLNIALQNGKNILIQLGDTLKTMLLPFIEKGATLLRKLNDWLVNLSREEKEQIVKLAVIAAAIGPVLMVLGKLTSSVGSIITTFGKIPGAITKLSTGFTSLKGTLFGVAPGIETTESGITTVAGKIGLLSKAFTALTGPVGIVIAIIAVLTAAFVSLWKNNEEFRNKIIAIWDGIKSKFESFAQGIVDRLNTLGFDFENFGKVVKAIWDGFCSVLVPIFEAAFEIISSILGTVLDTLTGILDVFIGIFTGNWEQCWNGIKEIFVGIWNGLVGILQSLGSMLLGIFDTVCGWFGTTWDETWTNIKQFFVNIWNAIKLVITTALNNIKTVITNVFNAVKTFASSVWNDIKKKISGPIESARSKVVSAVDGIKSKFLSGFTAAKNTVSSIFESIKNKITSTIENARDKVKSAIEKIKGFFNFSWSLPKLKLPHISITGSFSLSPPSVPKFGIEWYSKAMNNGMILDAATIFGFNSKTGKFLGGGEAGSETIVGTQSLLKMIKQAVHEAVGPLVKASYELAKASVELGYVTYNGFTKLKETKDKQDNNDKSRTGGGDTFIFNSPKHIDEIEAAKQMKRTKKELAEGF